jgi:hypothetical protein
VNIIENLVFLLVGVENNVTVSIEELTVFLLRPFLNLELFNTPDLNSGGLVD